MLPKEFKYLKGTTNVGLWYPNEAIYLEQASSHGTTKSKHVLLSQLMKLNTLQLGAVMLKFLSLNNNLVIMVLKSQRYLYSVITIVPLISLKIHCIILEQSI